MRSKKVWRYYCDHCNKGGCGKGAMAKHERSCARNPERVCRMCLAGGLEQRPMMELIEGASSVDELRKAANGCPACMLAGAIQAHPEKHTPCADDGYYDPRVFVDFKDEARRFWANVNDHAEELEAQRWGRPG